MSSEATSVTSARSRVSSRFTRSSTGRGRHSGSSTTRTTSENSLTGRTGPDHLSRPGNPGRDTFAEEPRKTERRPLSVLPSCGGPPPQTEVPGAAISRALATTTNPRWPQIAAHDRRLVPRRTRDVRGGGPRPKNPRHRLLPCGHCPVHQAGEHGGRGT